MKVPCSLLFPLWAISEWFLPRSFLLIPLLICALFEQAFFWYVPSLVSLWLHSSPSDRLTELLQPKFQEASHFTTTFRFCHSVLYLSCQHWQVIMASVSKELCKKTSDLSLFLFTVISISLLFLNLFTLPQFLELITPPDKLTHIFFSHPQLPQWLVSFCFLRHHYFPLLTYPSHILCSNYSNVPRFHFSHPYGLQLETEKPSQ